MSSKSTITIYLKILFLSRIISLNKCSEKIKILERPNSSRQGDDPSNISREGKEKRKTYWIDTRRYKSLTLQTIIIK